MIGYTNSGGQWSYGSFDASGRVEVWANADGNGHTMWQFYSDEGRLLEEDWNERDEGVTPSFLAMLLLRAASLGAVSLSAHERARAMRLAPVSMAG